MAIATDLHTCRRGCVGVAMATDLPTCRRGCAGVAIATDLPACRWGYERDGDTCPVNTPASIDRLGGLVSNDEGSKERVDGAELLLWIS